MSITVGEICAGYGGIGLGLGMLGETRTAWVADMSAIVPADWTTDATWTAIHHTDHTEGPRS